MKAEQFPNSRKLSHCQVCLVFWNLRGQHNCEETHTHTKNRHLTATASKDVARTLTSATSDQGLDREVRVVSLVLRVRTGSERQRTI